ncbi:LysR family transcriptional regulator [Verminephrobacter eiseniae]|uniref:LysR family transcriptional regulator n=1 Tax=Verminephrobacter eiseniae TaxID=364317 RepID=UPI00223735C2|nr:LysR family transcriptional regulator [Verminephrobacter eiseniae]MCW5235335.1 LysR family transcriptional regulator [Verminephrobacter eiseniae]
MKLHLLRYFAVLAEELHFGHAAERLAITQPPLSSGIKALEDELGVRLFERSSKHVALTAAGQAYLAEVRVVLEHVARAGETARCVAAGLRGRLDIGFAGSMVYRDMPGIVRAFGQRAPGIEVNLREMSSGEQLEALRHRQLHAGFINTGAVPEPLCSLPLAPDHFVCCLPEDHALAGAASVDLRALAAETFVMFSRAVAPANHDNVIALFQRAGIHPRILHATRQWLTVLTLVALRMGVALVPACMVQAAVKGVRLLPIARLRHPCVGVLAWHQDAVTPALRGFLDVAAANRL